MEDRRDGDLKEKLMARERETAYLREYDEMTGLLNRRAFEREAERLDREGRLPFSVVIGDIDGTKAVNDALGSAEGDALICRIAGVLKKCARRGDVLARTDGDAFGILLPGTGMDGAAGLIKKIGAACRELETKSEVYYASISMGAAAKTDRRAPVGSVIGEAEDNMVRRKLLEKGSLHSSLLSFVKAALQEKNFPTEEHSERLALLSFALGKALGVPDELLCRLELASTLHDIGKIAVDAGILDKAGCLTPGEWEAVKKHPEAGYRIAMASGELAPVAEAIRCHHERWDGKGYPRGLKGEEIPLLARILAVTDSYDAMTAGRPYRNALSREEAAAEITRNAGRQFDPLVAKIFADILTSADG